jgi:hypothetical protein
VTEISTNIFWSSVRYSRRLDIHNCRENSLADVGDILGCSGNPLTDPLVSIPAVMIFREEKETRHEEGYRAACRRHLR